MNRTLLTAFFVMTLLNTLVSLYGFSKINQTVNDLKKLEPKLKTNLWMQTLHGFLLVLQMSAVGISTGVSIFNYNFNIGKKAYYFTYIACYGIDFLVQIIICCICWVQGSDTGLTRHECYIWTDRFGQRHIKI